MPQTRVQSRFGRKTARPGVSNRVWPVLKMPWQRKLLRQRLCFLFHRVSAAARNLLFMTKSCGRRGRWALGCIGTRVCRFGRAQSFDQGRSVQNRDATAERAASARLRSWLPIDRKRAGSHGLLRYGEGYAGALVRTRGRATIASRTQISGSRRFVRYTHYEGCLVVPEVGVG